MSSMAFLSSVPAGSFAVSRAPQPSASTRRAPRNTITMGGNIREMRNRITSVKNTQKITDAMRLVAAAKVRRAQDAVLRTRPFSETLQKVLGGLLIRIGPEAADIPLLKERPVKNVVVVVVTGDRGLCGSYNSYAIKKATARVAELKAEGVEAEMITIGKKGHLWFKSRESIRRDFECGQAPNAEQATAITEELLAEYLSGEVDRVELIYTRFVSLISSEPAIRTLLPLSPTGIETSEDELFQLTTRGGKLAVETGSSPAAEPEKFPRDMIFEQDPEQMLSALLPLYLNGQVLRALQESVAAELASRMSAMSSASDNAKNLKKDLSIEYNRVRQAGITQELMEIVAGAAALG
mmetsp:Transcript_44172/g.108497  ORF Transcript_44172/g.108497 Transcript_44172/m.108497 type:complete len:352 (+) Transcript_44172:130-1185(+)|eukprot:CAMPEP_0198307958 /NCGR_PEP_ID=MMETSP1450-20131203/756_1 /TAXON_ID=753684 ORGANISM="Madagascaria erythrocladiodes, Strain CCMP3234" /NCGR_SAMPLE_ID=MMETSP1450 /ASSEMBLY_ACC=CAM_ASM_001115 /LENGTH=351 /DNA_ID=CAMNT_0044010585 /DNA_START=114 /DNA_END=1169 /DNA_ORIENTATION=-